MTALLHYAREWGDSLLHSHVGHLCSLCVMETPAMNRAAAIVDFR